MSEESRRRPPDTDRSAPRSAPCMYHVELRQFPHNLCRFNLTEQQLLAGIVVPWAHEQWIELGERKWSPHQARLTVLEGPALPVEQLSMGRGWRNAQRQGEDVTESLLAAARQTESSPPAARRAEPQAGGLASAPALLAAAASAGEAQLLADSLGLELLGTLAAEPVPLQRAWELAQARHPGGAPSETLAMAELAVRSLLRSGLLLLSGEHHGGGVAATSAAVEDPQATLRAIASWSGASAGPPVWMRRS